MSLLGGSLQAHLTYSIPGVDVKKLTNVAVASPHAKMDGIMTTRFVWALGVYAVLALLAAFTLDGNLRLAVWILLAGLTVKTCIAYKAGW